MTLWCLLCYAISTFGKLLTNDKKAVVSRTHSYRQQRQIATRERVLEAAVELAHEEGWHNVTMRKVAERVEYTHAALYAYFASKEDLFLALVSRGLQLLRESLKAAQNAAQTPEDALRAVAAAYWDFAWQYPELYQVIHGLGGVAFSTEDTIFEGHYIGEPVGAIVAELLVQHGKEPQNVDQKVDLLWSTIHGLVSLTMAGRFSRSQSTALVEQAICDALRAWSVSS